MGTWVWEAFSLDATVARIGTPEPLPCPPSMLALPLLPSQPNSMGIGRGGGCRWWGRAM